MIEIVFYALLGAVRAVVLTTESACADIAERVAEARIIDGAHGRLIDLVGPKEAIEITGNVMVIALHTTGKRYSAALSRELSEAVWQHEHMPRDEPASRAHASRHKGADLRDAGDLDDIRAELKGLRWALGDAEGGL